MKPSRGVGRPVVLVILTALVGSSLWLGGCSAPPSAWPAGKSPRVLAAFPPLYCFAANLVGDETALLCLLTTSGPHDYQVTPKDAILVGGADIFLTNGLGLDDTFTSRLKNSSGNLKLRAFELGEAIPVAQRRKLTEAEKHSHDGHNHSQGEYDPHMWLGIPEAMLMVERLRDELKTLDPAQADQYQQRAATYTAKLKELHAKGQALFKALPPERRRIVTMHDSSQYFARAFGLTIADCIQPRAGVELDAAQMARLVELCKKEAIRVVAVEPQYPETAAKTLCDEVARKGVLAPKIIPFDPLETADPQELNAEWYEKKMWQNLETLAEALR